MNPRHLKINIMPLLGNEIAINKEQIKKGQAHKYAMQKRIDKAKTFIHKR